MTLIFSLLLGATSVFAQQDPAAKVYLDKLSAKGKTYKTISAKFESQVLNESEGIDVKNTGSILIKDKKYRLFVGGNTIIFDGNAMYTISDDCDCYINDAPEAGEYGIDPSNLFNIYNSDFKYSLDKESDEFVVISLFPKNPDDAPFHTIIMTIDKKKMELSKIVVRGRENNSYIYKILEFTPNVPVSENKLKFLKSEFPCVEECLDMRDEE